MSDQCRIENHLTDEALRRLAGGRARAQEKLEALVHIQGCEPCAARFAEWIEQEELLSLPPQFAEGVERKLGEIRLTATPLSMGRWASENAVAASSKTRDVKKEYRRFSCRVAIAACIALIMLFSGTFSMGMNALTNSRVLNPDLSVVNKITQSLSDFSRDMVQWEGRYND